MINGNKRNIKFRYLNGSRRKERPKRNKMTLVIGAKCRDGIVLIGDKQVTRGTSTSEENKISPIEAIGGVYVGASGDVAFFDKFKRQIKLDVGYIRQQKGADKPIYDNIEQFIVHCEDKLRYFTKQYELQDKSGDVIPVLQILVAVKLADSVSGDSTSLHYIDNVSCAEQEVKGCHAIGNGATQADFYLGRLWKNDMTIKQTIQLALFIFQLIDKYNLNISVGNKPQVFSILNQGDAKDLSDAEISTLIKDAEKLFEFYDKSLGDMSAFLRK